MTKTYTKNSVLIIIVLIIILIAAGFLAFRYFKPAPSEKEALKPTPEKLFVIPPEHTLLKEEPGVGGEIKHPVGKEEFRDFSFYHVYFSPDNKRFAYATEKDGKYFFVVDGKEEKPYDEICEKFTFGSDAFVFSPDSKHYAYCARRNNQGYIIFDGTEQEKYNWVHSPIFSPDSKRFAYVAIDTDKDFGFFNKFIAHAAIGARHFVILDGKEQKRYRRISNLTFSPDSKHFTYRAQQGKSWFVVFDGVEQKQYDDVGELSFSPDGKHFAYAAKEGEDWFVVFDGKEQKKYEGRVKSLTFSSDGKHFAYKVEEKKSFVVLDGKNQKKYDMVAYSLVFSPDSKHLAYIAAEGTFGTKEDKIATFLVLDGKEQKKYEMVYGSLAFPTFSPDSRHLAYIVRIKTGEESEFMVLDEKEYKKGYGLSIHHISFSDDPIFQPIFSPDSKHFAYVAEKDGKPFVVLDNIAQEKYDLISNYRFDPESKYLFYNAIIDQEVWSVTKEVK